MTMAFPGEGWLYDPGSAMNFGRGWGVTQWDFERVSQPSAA
jgi:hypothetical protein